jgi:hypothetical protein
MNKSVKSLLLRTLLRSGEDASLGGSNLTAATPDNDAEFVTPPDSLPKLRDDNLQLAAAFAGNVSQKPLVHRNNLHVAFRART